MAILLISSLHPYSTTWFSICFKDDARIIAKASELHDQLVAETKEFIPDGDFITQCVYQPLPTLFAAQSQAAGGNIMGIERHAHNGILFAATAMVKTPEQEAFVYPKVKRWIDDLTEYAATIEGGLQNWIYLNYADRSQEVLRSYGEENVGKIRDAADKYDPEGIFQTLCPGGFKIREVV